MKKAEKKKNLIFVVKAHELSAIEFEAYLKNRGWEILSTGDLKRAVTDLLNQPVRCVLVSVDHPNPKCMMLPEIIAKMIKVPVILFAENVNRSSNNILRGTEHPYILFPPVRGPAIERLILKIERDRNRPDTPTKSEFRGQQDYSTADIIHFFEGEGQSPIKSAEAGHLVAADGNFGTQLSQLAKTKSPLEQSGSCTDILAYRQRKPDETKKSASSDQPDSPASFAEDMELDHLKVHRLSESDHKRRSDSTSSMEIKKASDQESYGNTDAKSVLAEFNLKYASAKIEIFDSDSELVKGTEHALLCASNSNLLDHCRVTGVTNCSRVNCFYMQSDRFSGYIVVVFESDRYIDKKFIENLRLHLIGYLEQNGVEVAAGEILEIKVVAEISFEKLSIKEAAFLRKSIHNGNEVVLAFFPFIEKQSPLELSAESHMLCVDLNEIRTNRPLEFDLYLYLPINQKYILYIARDRIMYDDQHSRLISSGVTQIHICRDSERDLARYRVQNFFNDLIMCYKKIAA